MYHSTHAFFPVIVMARYSNQALILIKEKKNFEVLSYHSCNVKVISNYLKLDDKLKPVENEIIRNRRSDGADYAKLAVNLDFSLPGPLRDY